MNRRGDGSKERPLWRLFSRLEALIDQQPDGSTIGYAPGQSAEVDPIVHTGCATVAAIAAPQTEVRIEPPAGRVVVVERAAADQGARLAGSQDDARIAHLMQRRTTRLDPRNQPCRSGGTASTRVVWEPRLDLIAQRGEKGAGERPVARSDGSAVQGAIQPSAGMDRGSDGAVTPGLELTASPGGGAQRGGEQEPACEAKPRAKLGRVPTSHS